MHEYIIYWETDYCDDFPERSGETYIIADTEEEAVKKFYALKIPKSIIFRIEERKKTEC